jgi:hypothetical protein
MFTGLLIAILIIAGAATVVGGGLVLAQRRQGLPGGGDRPALPPAGRGGARALERTIHDVRVGDVVTQGAQDFLVEGVIQYDEDGHVWRSARVIDGTDTHWLMIGLERIGPVVLRWLEVDESLELAGYPPETLFAGGVRYTLDRRGTASCRFTGDVGRLPGTRSGPAEAVERCRWWKYDAAGDDTLIVEQWSGEYRALRGSTVNDALIDLIPGS